MKTNMISVIPPNVPSARYKEQSFGMYDEKELHLQKKELDKLAKEKNNPFAGIINVLAVVTGAILTFAAMRVTMNKSLSLIGDALKNKYVQKIGSGAADLLKKSGKLFMSGLNSALDAAADSTLVQKFNNTKAGAWINPKAKTLKDAAKTLFTEVHEVVSQKAPKKEEVKNAFVNAVATLTAMGVLLRELVTSDSDKARQAKTEGEVF